MLPSKQTCLAYGDAEASKSGAVLLSKHNNMMLKHCLQIHCPDAGAELLSKDYNISLKHRLQVYCLMYEQILHNKQRVVV